MRLKLMAAMAIMLVTLIITAFVSSSSMAWPWWLWPLLLFVISIEIGILAVLSGLGGGVLFVSLVGGLGPFHLDFVRGLGLLVALSGALAAAPKLLRMNLAALNLAMPLALFSSAGSIAGALVGLKAPLAWLQISLGLVILAMCFMMVMLRGKEAPQPGHPPEIMRGLLSLSGFYREPGQAEPLFWQARRLPWACLIFTMIGFIAGLFGLGAGWANVPAMNLFMGAPLKISVATSGLLIGMSGSPAVLIYLTQGALPPIIAAPSVLGMMLGAKIGAGFLGLFKAEQVRWLTVGILTISGLKSLLTGLGL